MGNDFSTLIDTNFSEIKGHSFQKEIFKKLILSDKLHSTYLFYGPPGVGKKLFATAIARTILKRDSNKEPEHHPDFLLIEPDKRDITVDRIREVIEFTIHPPLEASRKIVIIDDAHKLNLQSGNALLKTLEEPPSFMLFFLITPSLETILPTIRSRSIKIPFNPLTPAEMEVFIREHDLRADDMLLSLFYGQPGLILSQNKDYYRQLAEKLVYFFTGNLEHMIDFPGNRKLDSSDMEILIRAIYSILGDIVRIMNNLPPIRWTNLTKYEKIITERWDMQKIEKIYEIVSKMESEMKFSQNIKLFVDLMLIAGVN